MRRDHTFLTEKLSAKKLALFALLVLVIPGAVAYAGFFSLFGEIFSSVEVEERPVNSQNMRLLAAAFESHQGVGARDGLTMTRDGAVFPESGPEGGIADIEGAFAEHGDISTYVVREGDSFSAIAEMFDVSVNTILWANNLPRGAKLTIGQTLVILPVSGVQHTVKKGDTVASVAKKYKGDLEEILAYNGIEEDAKLEIGSTIIVPDGEIPAPVPVVRPATSKLRSAGGPSYDGYYRAPMANYRRSQGLHGYNGVDLVSLDGPGSYVMAAASGEVIISRDGCRSRGCNGGYGNYVVIKHPNGTQTLYAHLKGTAISAGQYVAQGQLIGYEGNTGRSTGTHLHFEVRGARNPF